MFQKFDEKHWPWVFLGFHLPLLVSLIFIELIVSHYLLV